MVTERERCMHHFEPEKQKSVHEVSVQGFLAFKTKENKNYNKTTKQCSIIMIKITLI